MKRLLFRTPLDGFFQLYKIVWTFLEIEEKGEEAEQRVFKSRLERNKYTDFTFKFLSRLDMQNYQMNLPDFY